MIPMPVFMLIDVVLRFYIFLIFVMVIMSWLLMFNVINRHNRFVDAVWRTLLGLTEPLLKPIRKRLPDMGGIDISPVILIFAIFFLQWMNQWLAVRIGV